VKIDPSVSKNTADIGNAKDSAARAQTAATPARQGPARGTSRGSDEVNLSPLSSTLRSGGTDVGDIDTQTIEQIKDAISKNQLPIDTGKIADGLIDSVRSFLKTS
jgi:negative regulator of flagellin synthesis FlgM